MDHSKGVGICTPPPWEQSKRYIFHCFLSPPPIIHAQLETLIPIAWRSVQKTSCHTWALTKHQPVEWQSPTTYTYLYIWSTAQVLSSSPLSTSSSLFPRLGDKFSPLLKPSSLYLLILQGKFTYTFQSNEHITVLLCILLNIVINSSHLCLLTPWRASWGLFLFVWTSSGKPGLVWNVSPGWKLKEGTLDK